MELPVSLYFDKRARPHGIGYKHGIRNHPAVCGVCTNFDLEVAKIIYMPAMNDGLWIGAKDSSVTRTMTMQDVAVAADKGCYSCLVLKIFTEQMGPWSFDCDSESEMTITYLAGTVMSLKIEEENGNTLHLELFTLPGEPCVWPTIGSDTVHLDPVRETWPVVGGTASIVPPHSFSPVCFANIKDWISRCRRDHPYCDVEYRAAGSKQAFNDLPKRLISVGYCESDIRLFDSANASHTYIALSYCWGEARGLTLETRNEGQFYDSIPWHGLLQTHKDAIIIARELGIRYLWTDSLCIVQDDNDEKMSEIAKMASIYARAFATIAATAAQDGGQGCLKPRAQTYALPVTDEDGSTYRIFCRERIPHDIFDFTSLDVEDNEPFTLEMLEKHPLFSRGWTFQERLLSTRVIHYTTHEITWECMGMSCCECGTMDDFVASRALRDRRFAAGIPQDVEVKYGKLERSQKNAKRYGMLGWGERRTDSDISYLLRTIPARMLNDYGLMRAIMGRPVPVKDAEAQRNGRWRILIAQYSQRSLKYSTDVLPAVSGLATAWSTTMENPPRYLAGLWEDDLQRSLLWKPVEDNDVPRPENYLAPTWSWASIRRIVGWFPDKSDYDPIQRAHILAADCSPSTANVFGQVDYGYLTVRGPIVVAQVIGTVFDGRVIIKAGDRNTNFKPDDIVEGRGLIGEMVHCLWWSTDVNDPRTEMGWERALVLRSCGRTSDTFTRVGLLEWLPVEEWRGMMGERTVTIL